MKTSLAPFLSITFLVLFMPLLGKAQLGEFALGALSDLGSGVIDEGFGSLFDWLLGAGEKKPLQEVLDDLNEALQELNQIQSIEQQIIQDLNVISLNIDERISQEFRTYLDVIRILDNDFIVFLQQVQNGFYVFADPCDNAPVADLASRLRSRIEAHIQTAVEKIHESVSDFMTDLLTELISNNTDIVNTNLNINYALSVFGRAYRTAVYLLTAAQKSSYYLEGAVNNTYLYYAQLKDWQDLYLSSPIASLVSSILNNTAYTAPTFNNFRTYDFYNCINYTSSLIYGAPQFRYWYPDNITGCQNYGIVSISRGVSFTLQSPTFTVQIHNSTGPGTYTMATDSSIPTNVVAATATTPAFNQTWNITHPPLEFAYIPLNQSMSFVTFQQKGSFLSRDTNVSLYKMFLSELNTSALQWQAFTVGFSPALTNATITDDKVYKTIQFYPDLSLGFSADTANPPNGPVYLDWYTDPTVDSNGSLQNQWLQVKVPNKNTFLWINRYYNFALTTFNGTTLGLAPLYANISNTYAGTVAGTYVNQEWSLYSSADTVWADPWNQSTYTFRQLDNNQEMRISLPLSLSGDIDFDFRSLPLTLELVPQKNKAREQIFYLQSTDSFSPLQSGHTYQIGCWRNASNALSGFDYVGDTVARSWEPSEIKEPGDVEWIFTQNGSLYTIQNGPNCLTVGPGPNTTVANATVTACEDGASTQQFIVAADPAYAGLAYNISTNDGRRLAAISTVGAGDSWYFYPITTQPSDATLLRVRLYYVA